MRPRLSIPLTHPVVVDGVRYDELRFRPAKLKDRGRVFGSSKFDLAINVAARLAGVPPAAIVMLSDEDRESVGQAVKGLIGPLTDG